MLLLMFMMVMVMMMIRILIHILCLYILLVLTGSRQPLSDIWFTIVQQMWTTDGTRDAIKLLFIFVFISHQHHTSFSQHRQWLRRRGFVAFAFIRSQSLSLSLSHLSFSFIPFLLFFICFKVALLFYLQNNTSKLH